MSGPNPDSTSVSQEQKQEETSRRFHTSVLFERHVIWVVLALLLAFIWYKVIPLIILASFFLLILIIVSLWKKHSLRQVIPSLELSKPRVFTGEQFDLTAQLHNRKWLPLVWIEFEHQQHPHITWGNDHINEYRIRFLWLLWHQKVSWTMEGHVHRRGVYQLGNCLLRSGDGFRFTEQEKQVALPVQLHVYPKLISVHVPSLTSFVQWGVNGKNGGHIVDPQLIHSIRDYQDGDEWRSIHWQASARTGELQTKVYQPVLIRQLNLYIDVTGFAGENRSDEFETFLSVIASLTVSYHQQGVMIGLITNALDYEGKPMNGCPPGASLTAVLDQFAAITPSLNTSSSAGIAQLSGKAAPLYYFCDQLSEAQQYWWETNKKKMPAVCFYYLRENQTVKVFDVATKRLDSLVTLKGQRS